MAVNMKLGVDLSGFKQGISEANAQLKKFDAQIKLAESSFKKTGDAEAAMYQKTDALTNKLKIQKQMVQQYWQTLEKMRTSGVDPMSKSYQQMEAAMLNMEAAANETEMALNGLNISQLNAASSADKLTQSVNGIGKKISLDQVINGIDKITGGLENAARKAVQVGESIWTNILDSARLADDTGTAAMLLDMDVEEYQKYKGVFDTIAEMTVSDWMNAKRKVQKAINDPTNDQSAVLAALGVGTHGEAAGKYGTVQTVARGWEDVFWDAAKQLRTKVENGEISQDMADTYAEALFGKKAAQLKPLMELGQEGFTAALEEQNVASAEAIEKDAKLADTVTKLNNSFKAVEMELISAMAPALTSLAESLDSLLGKVLEYLQSDDGKAMMESLGKSLEELFGGIKNINPEEIVQKFVNVFNDIVGGLKWIIDNKDSVVRALEGVVFGWAGLKLTGGALEIMKLINGVKSFQGVPTETPSSVTGGNGDVIATGAGDGAGATGGFWSNLLNKMTLFGLANAMYEGTEGKLRKMRDDFLNQTAGMTPEQRNKVLVMQEFHMSEEEYDNMFSKMNAEKGGVPVEVKPEVPEDAAANIADQVGAVTVPLRFDIPGISFGGAGGGGNNVLMKKANGLPFVPYDGYLSLLHRGERVMTASENRHYTYNSNTYFGSVNLHNGLEVDALAESIARNNRRKSRGFGS